MMRVDWSTFKSLAEAKGLSPQVVETSGYYHLYAYDGAFNFECRLFKNNDQEAIADFQETFSGKINKPLKPRDSVLGREVVVTTAFAINTDYEVKATGYSGTATKTETTNLDFPIGNEDRYIDGLRIILYNHHEDDKIDFSVVDKDGVLAPPGTVLKQFGFDWNVDASKACQEKEGFNYLARIPAGLYMRFTYKSQGTQNDVKVKLNAYLHKRVLPT
jgi:hypothetical protein